MTFCPHTGVSRPECSCRACLQAQIELHMPSLLGAAIPAAEEVQVEVAPRRFGVRGRLRRGRLRRAA